MRQRLNRFCCLAFLFLLVCLLPHAAFAEGYSAAGTVYFDSYGLSTILTDAFPETLRLTAHGLPDEPNSDAVFEWVINFDTDYLTPYGYEAYAPLPDGSGIYTLYADRTAYGVALTMELCTDDNPPVAITQNDWLHYEITSSEAPYSGYQAADGFYKVSGPNILDADGNVITLRSIGMTANYFDSDTNKGSPARWTISEAAFQELHELGFNCVRLVFGYQLLEDDSRPFVYKQEGWAWLDQIAAWAEKYDMKICLNMHSSPGGTQYTAKGVGLWSNEEFRDGQLNPIPGNDCVQNQDRVVALWRAIAERYRDNTTFVGWGLLNELHIPLYDDGFMIKANILYSSLFQRIIDAIREVDQNHIIFAERALWTYPMYNTFFRAVSDAIDPGSFGSSLLAKTAGWVKSNFNTAGTAINVFESSMYYPLIRDNNLVFEWHDYRQRPRDGVALISKEQSAALLEEGNDLFRRNHGDCPIFIGEYGAPWAYDETDADMIQWVKDLDEICEERGYSRNLHCYYGYNKPGSPYSSMGLRYVTQWGASREYSTLYEPLANVFRSAYGQ